MSAVSTTSQASDSTPSSPVYRLPSQTCDTHCHIFGPVARYPYAPRRPYTPAEAPLPMLRALHDRIGVDRAVLVNPTAYGCDNSAIVDAIAESDGRYRGVATIDGATTDRELEALAAAGIDGCRFTFLARLGGRPDLNELHRLAARIAPMRWHLDLYLEAATLNELVPWLRSLPVPYVIDHMGTVDASGGVDQPAFRTLLALLGSDEKCWVKITGPERVSRIGPPFHDAVPFARQLIVTAPHRVLWGTDWPHPNVPFVPDDGDLVDLVPLYADDPVMRQRLLVDNPHQLFRFPRST